MGENLDVLNTAASLLIRAALLAAQFSGQYQLQVDSTVTTLRCRLNGSSDSRISGNWFANRRLNNGLSRPSVITCIALLE